MTSLTYSTRYYDVTNLLTNPGLVLEAALVRTCDRGEYNRYEHPGVSIIVLEVFPKNGLVDQVKGNTNVVYGDDNGGWLYLC